MKYAADQDHGLALHALGYMYLDGDCTNQDNQKAVACFEKAVDLGFEGSMLALAQMLRDGGCTSPPRPPRSTLGLRAVCRMPGVRTNCSLIHLQRQASLAGVSYRWAFAPSRQHAGGPHELEFRVSV